MLDKLQTDGPGAAGSVQDLVFVGLNKRVAALDRYTGKLRWEWKASQGSGYVTLVLDGDRLVVSVNGYVYCLDPLYGQEVWSNPMKGFGVGVTSLASARAAASSDPNVAAASLAAQQAQAAT